MEARSFAPEFTSRQVLTVQLGVLLAALARGLDYIALPDDEPVKTLTFVEAALPLAVWGWCYLVASTAAMAAVALKRHAVAVVMHGALMGIYLAFGIGALVSVEAQYDFYGWRTGVGWIVGAALIHYMLAEALMSEWRSRRATR